jgi:hypothetical protein
MNTEKKPIPNLIERKPFLSPRGREIPRPSGWCPKIEERASQHRLGHADPYVFDRQPNAVFTLRKFDRYQTPIVRAQ